MKALNWTTFILVVIGGLNWGLVGFFNFDLVATIFGDMSMASRVVYSLVGLSAIYMAVTGGQMMTAGMEDRSKMMPSGKIV